MWQLLYKKLVLCYVIVLYVILCLYMEKKIKKIDMLYSKGQKNSHWAWATDSLGRPWLLLTWNALALLDPNLLLKIVSEFSAVIIFS